jgi:hypothetical protein
VFLSNGNGSADKVYAAICEYVDKRKSKCKVSAR